MVFFLEKKIRNIEETDKAKRKLLQTLCDKKGVEKKISAIIGQAATPISLLASTTAIPTTPSKTASVSFCTTQTMYVKYFFSIGYFIYFLSLIVNTDGMDI